LLQHHALILRWYRLFHLTKRTRTLGVQRVLDK
jgi:hypothetical protein